MIQCLTFTPTQQKIVDLLSDGLPHTRKEVHACLWDELSPLSNIKAHITAIRKKIRPLGQDIICEYNGKIHYRHVRLLASAYDGKR